MDDDQQFCLRWNNHQSTLISVFDTLLENGTLVDCTLAAEGKFLKAHKVVLSACSPYFAALLSQQYDKHPIFILKDVKFQELRAMMDYMYRGEVNISQDQLAALLKAAESLQIKGLSDNRSSSAAPSQQKQAQNEGSASKSLLAPVVPANKASGLTIENKRPLKPDILESDVSGSREGSVSPTLRKRKKIRRRSVDNNNLIDNHDQHSNSSSHSMHTSLQPQPQPLTSSVVVGPPANNNVATSIVPSAPAPSISSNVLSTPSVAAVAATAAASIKKTDSVQQQQVAEALKLQLVKHQSQQQSVQQQQLQQQQLQQIQQQTEDEERSSAEQAEEHDDHDSDNDTDDSQRPTQSGPGGLAESQDAKAINQSELMIEPKNEYDDGQDENVEDLTLDEEELLDDLDQAGPSHGGEGSSQSYAQWQMDREHSEAFMAAQDAVGGQHRDAQVSISAGRSTPSGQGSGGKSMIIHSEVIVGAGAHQQQSQPPMDDQPCDLRLLTPSYLREFGAEPSAQQRELLAAAAAAAAAAANASGSSSNPLPVPLFKGINITTPPTVPSSIGGAYTCSRCGNSYARPHSLNRHIRFECGVEPKFECPVCHKKSKHKHNLVLHMRTHQHR